MNSMCDITDLSDDFPCITLDLTDLDNDLDIDTVTISNSIYTSDFEDYSSVNIDGNMKVSGDIVVGGQSLLNKIEKIEQRLNILEPNHRLEKDWKELADLGKQYRALEKKIEERLKVWDRLQSQDTE